jgi:curved DNA-binding protein CbpA
MTPQNDLEIQGNFFTHPFAELLSEIANARLHGSLRVTDKQKKRKLVVYFKSGKVVFAVSNAKTSRLFFILLSQGRLSKDDIVQVPNYANDLEFASFLQKNQVLTNEAADRLFVDQIESILVETISWPEGDWTFSSLARVREGLSFEIDARRLLLDYARSLPAEKILGRFRSMEEGFSWSEMVRGSVELTTEEEFILSRATLQPLSAAAYVQMSAIPEAATLRSLYSLWLAGFLVRDDWSPAFTQSQIAAMRGAKLELRREAKVPVAEPVAEVPSEPQAPAPEPAASTVPISVEQYLDQVEKGATFYDMLDVHPKAEYDEIKKAYFRLARSFHPDRYHAGGGELFRRVQNAFTEIAQAHETLKQPDTREIYDYRIRKELASREKIASHTGESRTEAMNYQRAVENFDAGFSLLMDGDPEQALPFLARAAHFDPKNARYRAYYGKALSTDAKQRHKAESEIQAAVKLEPTKPTFRIILAEFFVQFNLLKRAEGELKRLLAVFPSNREALDMLEELKS